jgi:flagellar protein FlgJ
MTTPAVSPSSYTDFGGLEALKKSARGSESGALREAARQFESLFTSMLLKSMREASMGEGLGDSDETQFYQDMYDQQLAVQLSKGDGLGLAQKLVEQLTRSGLVPGNDAAGAHAPAATVDTHADDSARADFIRQLKPHADAAAAQLGVSADAVIAQAALETGWGRHVPTDSNGASYNYFGIKAANGSSGPQTVDATTEFDGQRMQTVAQPFRAYDSMAASVQDYTALLADNPRYSGTRNTGSDVSAFATALHRAGYATDPDYVRKLVATADSVRRLMQDDAFKQAAALPTTTGEGTT